MEVVSCFSKPLAINFHEVTLIFIAAVVDFLGLAEPKTTSPKNERFRDK